MRVRCRCGSLLQVPEQYVGSLVRCKACGAGVLPADALPEYAEGTRPAGEGLFSLHLGMLFHPVRTSKNLMYELSSPEMVAKTLAFYGSGLVLWLVLFPRITGEPAPWFTGLWSFLAAMGVGAGAQAMASVCVAAAGHWVTGARRYGEVILAEYFLGGVWFWGLVLPGLVAGTLGWGLSALRVGSLWLSVLVLLVTRAIFGCDLAKAIVIGIWAFVLEMALLFFLLLSGSLLVD